MFEARKTQLQDIALQSFGAFIAGSIGSLVLLVSIFVLSGVLDIQRNFGESIITQEHNPLFPFILSAITFFATMLCIFLFTHILSLIYPEKYKKSTIISGQLAVFGILVYICMTPIYIFMGMQDYENILLIFIIHSLILSFGSILLLEILHNIRSLIISFYACFLGLFGTSIMSLSIFQIFESGFAKLLSLLFLLPFILTSLIIIKCFGEFFYTLYREWSNYDPLGDMYDQIARREQEEFLEQTQKNIL